MAAEARQRDTKILTCRLPVVERAELQYDYSRL